MFLFESIPWYSAVAGCLGFMALRYIKHRNERIRLN